MSNISANNTGRSNEETLKLGIGTIMKTIWLTLRAFTFAQFPYRRTTPSAQVGSEVNHVLSIPQRRSFKGHGLPGHLFLGVAIGLVAIWEGIGTMLLSKLVKTKLKRELHRKELALDLDHFTDELQNGHDPNPAGLFTKYPTFKKEIDLQVYMIQLLEECRQHQSPGLESEELNVAGKSDPLHGSQ